LKRDSYIEIISLKLKRNKEEKKHARKNKKRNKTKKKRSMQGKIRKEN
jgi:hypothetical protein